MCYAYGMEITEAQYKLVEDCLPRQRGNVRVSNLDLLNAILYVAEKGLQMARCAPALRAVALYSALIRSRGDSRLIALHGMIDAWSRS